MRQKIGGGHPITIDSSCPEAGSQPIPAPAVFNKNQNSALCLPMLSEIQKIIWVHSDQINIPMEKAAKLDEAFSRFPYVTRKQTLSLAQHCSLHPDQVKVWFMAQRLCYGISWDAKDIHEVKKKMLGGSTLKTQIKNEKENAAKSKLNRDEGNAEYIKRKLSNAAPDGQMSTENMQGRGRKRKALKRNEGNPGDIVKKTSRTLCPPRDTLISAKEAKSDALPGSHTKAETATVHKTENDCFAIPDESLDRSPSVTSQSQRSSSVAPLLLVKREMEQMETINQPPQMQMVTKGSQTSTPPRKKKGSKNRQSLPRCTPKQLALMKIEFMKRQYPTDEQYLKLSSLSGVPRYRLVQWFNDMRYFIKKGKPMWMTVEQHKAAVANVVHEQCLRKMQK